MSGFRSSKTSAVLAAASVLAYKTTGALASSQPQYLRHRHLQTLTREYERLGCFKDNKNDRILGNKMVDDRQQTADFCYDYCVGLGAPLMATQYGIECWCATEVDVDFERHGDGAECNYPCAGDEDEMCGGYDAIDLYQIESDGGPITRSRDYERLGCFKDSKNDRILGNKMVDREQQSADFCYDYCADLGAPLFATQYGVECWCATEVQAEVDFDRHGGGAECNYPCAGDEGEMCGGYDAIDLYRIGCDKEPESSLDSSSDSSSDSEEPEPSTTREGALVDDIVKIVEVTGTNPGGASWADSYSDGDKCYMWTTWDHGVGDVTVDTPVGPMTIRDLYDRLDEGPGHTGRPLYNDIQCGNGPTNDHNILDEVLCPGLVEYGREGCGQIGPMWDLSELE